MRRRRWPWIIALALAALMAGILFWPRHDDYAFLRELHPKEPFGVFGAETADPPPLSYHRFEFADPYSVVEHALRYAGAKPNAQSGSLPLASTEANVKLPTGELAEFAHHANGPVTLTIYGGEKLTWLQAWIEAIRGFFHH